MADRNTRHARANIETVARLEHEFLEARSVADRIGDFVAGFVGTMTFVLLHVVGVALWFIVNLGLLAPSIPPFDPYPFMLIAVLMSIEGVLLSTFILIKQNRMSRRADERDHLNLQIDLLAEKEITKILELQGRICQHFGIEVNQAELRELIQHTAVDDLARELKEKLPPD